MDVTIVKHRFNPRSRVGSDVIQNDEWNIVVSFNPRSRVGSDFKVGGLPILIAEFQSALPCGERPCGSRPASLPAGFNPRSRVGSDMV